MLTSKPSRTKPRRDSADLARVREAIISCDRCPRLRTYCQRIATEKKAAHRTDTYWGRPVPGFGDPHARVLVIGLAPAAHGANRTGRVFTGDGPLGSGDFLMRAMHAHGFASIPTARAADDGLVLTDAFIAAAVRCAPPDNKPTPAEIAACHDHLVAEVGGVTPGIDSDCPRPDRLRRRLASARRPRHHRPAPPGVCARCSLRSRRLHGDRVVSPEPAEHEHRQADARDDGCGICEGEETAVSSRLQLSTKKVLKAEAKLRS